MARRLSSIIALLLSGLLAGAFLRGWAIEAPTFAEVPLKVHLTYRVQLMEHNAVAMPTLGILSLLALIWASLAHRYAARWWSAGAAAFTAVVLLVTRFGNVPINGEIQKWESGDLAADYQDRLDRWGVFHDIRAAAAVGAFVLLIVAVDRSRSRGRTFHNHRRPA